MTKLKSSKLIKEQKQQLLKQLLTKVNLFLLFSHTQVKVNQFQSFKKELKKVGKDDKPIFLKVYKNTLLKKALQYSQFAKMTDTVSGCLFTVFSEQGSLSVFKTLYQLSKKHKLVFQSGFFENKLLDLTTFQKLALLPSKESLLLQLLGCLQLVFFSLLQTLKSIETVVVKN